MLELLEEVDELLEVEELLLVKLEVLELLELVELDELLDVEELEEVDELDEVNEEVDELEEEDSSSTTNELPGYAFPDAIRHASSIAPGNLARNQGRPTPVTAMRFSWVSIATSSFPTLCNHCRRPLVISTQSWSQHRCGFPTHPCHSSEPQACYATPCTAA